MRRIYVAGKYSASEVMTVFANMRNGIKACSQILALGYAPFCPWLDYHYCLVEEHPKQSMYDYSMAWLEAAEIVVLLPGWEASPGTLREKARAEELGIPVMTLDEFLSDASAEEEK